MTDGPDGRAGAETQADGEPAAVMASELSRLEARVAELTRERDNLASVVDIMEEINASLHFVEILQTISRKLGQTFGLDRCSIFLAGDQSDVRLVASYEDPSIRNMLVDLQRYPELQKAFSSGETVFVADAMNDPMLRAVRDRLDVRNVRSIVVVPIRWRQGVIGAIFLRTERTSAPFSDADVKFCQVIADLTAKALKNAHRFESLQLQRSETDKQRDRHRTALLAFLRRLIDRFEAGDEKAVSEARLPRATDEELERLVGVALQVIDGESHG